MNNNYLGLIKLCILLKYFNKVPQEFKQNIYQPICIEYMMCHCHDPGKVKSNQIKQDKR